MHTPSTPEGGPTAPASRPQGTVGEAGPWCTVAESPEPRDCTRWFVATVGEPTAWLAVADDVLVRRTTTGRVEGRSLHDGQLRWRWAEDVTTAAATDGVVVVAGRDGGVVGLDAGTGRSRWRDPTLAGGSAVLDAAAGRAVVVSPDGVVRRLDVATGAADWQAAVGTGTTSAVLMDGQVVVADAQDGTVTALDVRDGRRRWRSSASVPAADIELEAGAARIVATTTVANGLRAEGEVIELDPDTGEVRWRYVVGPERAGRSPTRLADETLVLGLRGPGAPTLLGLDRTGRTHWRTTLTVDAAVPVGELPGVVLVATPGDLLAVGTRDGAVRWRYGLATATATALDDGGVVVGGEALLVVVDPPGRPATAGT